jgi:uncharacterized membrane protein
MSNDVKNEPTDSPGLGTLVMAVLAGAIGVNSSKNRKKDFSAKSATPYIIAGILFTVLFMISLYGLIQWILPK